MANKHRLFHNLYSILNSIIQTFTKNWQTHHDHAINQRDRFLRLSKNTEIFATSQIIWKRIKLAARCLEIRACSYDPA